MAKTSNKKAILNELDKQLTLTDLFGEHVSLISISELFPPDIHPFGVNDDEQMASLAESVKQFGVLEPGLARPKKDDNGKLCVGYELLCGNRRKRACELSGITEMPVIIRNLTNEQAVLAMIDSNLQQRESILPSERAFAYKMKMDALNHNGIKAEKNSCDIMAEQTGESVAKIFRFIRLTNLVEALLDRLDTNGIAITPAIQLSYLSYKEQQIVVDCMDKYDMKPSLSQAVRLKKLSQAGTLTSEIIDAMLAEDKKLNADKPKGSLRFRKYFPPEYSQMQIEAIIVELLADWKSKCSN